MVFTTFTHNRKCLINLLHSYIYTQDTLNVTLTTLYGGPILSMQQGGYPAYLEWTGDDSFQISLQGFSRTFSCYILHGGHIGQRVYFQRGEGAIASLTLPGTVYGKVYKKDS